MEKLENIVKDARNIVNKHPVISTVAVMKVIDLAVFGAVYAIWPQETKQVLNHAYGVAQSTMPITLSLANLQKEILDVCKNPNTLKNVYTLHHLI